MSSEKNPISERHYPIGYEVWQWPEFRAFAERLGIELGEQLPTTGVAISIAYDKVVEVTHIYLAQDREHKPAETTNFHNQEFRTHQPLENSDEQ